MNVNLYVIKEYENETAFRHQKNKPNFITNCYYSTYNGTVVILDMIETGIREGATLALDGRGIVVPGCENGYFIGPTVFTDVKPGMEIHKTEGLNYLEIPIVA